jgi:NAD+ kinase
MTAMSQGQTPFRCVGVFGRPQTEGLGAPLRRILASIRKLGCAVWVENETAKSAGLTAAESDGQASLNALAERIDLAVILGGDGTLLGIARQ